MYEDEFEILNNRFNDYCSKRAGVRPFVRVWNFITGSDSGFNNEVSNTIRQLNKLEADARTLVASDVESYGISDSAIDAYMHVLEAFSGYSTMRASFIGGSSGLVGFMSGIYTTSAMEKGIPSDAALITLIGLIFLAMFLVNLSGEAVKRSNVASCAATFRLILDDCRIMKSGE